MQHQNLISNLSIFCNFPNGFQSLRDFILTQAISGTFSEIKPESWRQTTLGKEVEIIRGITFPSSAKFREPANERIVCLRTTNIQEQVDWEDLLYVPESYVSNSGQYIRKNDILISMANSRELVGKVSLVTRDDVRCTLGGFISAIRCSETILPEFLMIILRAPATREKIIDSSTQTTNIANISLGRLRPLEIFLPSISEQLNIIQKVTQLLKQCDEIETTFSRHKEIGTAARRSAIDAISTAESLEELQIAWERIEGNWEVIAGDPESMESISLLIHDLATQGFLSRGENFEVVQLKDIAQVNYGYTESAQRAEVGPKFLRITDIQLGKVNWDAVPYCPISNADEERHLLRDGDLVFARTGATTGKSFLLNNPPRSVCASYLIRVRPDARKVLPEYLYLYFQSGQYWVDVKSGMSGTAQGGFNSSKLGALAIKIPDLATQAEIVKKTNELLQVCEDLGEFLSRQQLLAERFARSVVSISA